jgi:hypothetical protein
MGLSTPGCKQFPMKLGRKVNGNTKKITGEAVMLYFSILLHWFEFAIAVLYAV